MSIPKARFHAGSDLPDLTNGGVRRLNRDRKQLEGMLSGRVGPRLDGWLTPQEFGAAGNGARDDRTALALADDAVGSEGALLLTPGTYRIDSDVTLASNVIMLEGAKLQPASGVTVTIEGRVVAEPENLDESAGGSFAFTDGSVLDAPQVDNVTVTVGDSGHFSTINEAIKHLSRRRPAYKTGGWTATINLLSGFTMEEQVLVRAINLGWITITADDATVPITRSALTTSMAGSFPAFGSWEDGVLPRIAALFDMDTSGSGTDRHGVYARQGGRAYIPDALGTAGVRNAGGVGVFAEYGGLIEMRGADFTGAGSHGMAARHSGVIQDRNGTDVSDAGGNGVLADWSGRVMCRGITADNAATHGIEAVNAGLVVARAASVGDAGEHGFFARYGGRIMARRSSTTQASAKRAGTNAVRVESGGQVELTGGGILSDATSDAVYCTDGGSVAGVAESTITGAGRHGIFAENGAEVDATEADISGAAERGVYSLWGARIVVTDANISDAGENGIHADRAEVWATGADASGATGLAVRATQGAFVKVADGDCSGASGGQGIRALLGARIDATGADAQRGGSPDSDDIRVSTGGTISASGATGGLWQTPNIVTPDGLILGDDKVTNNGTATVPNGSTSVSVSHGLDQTPDAEDISVTPTNDLGDAAKFWVSSVGASTFDINVDADPGADTATFAWMALIR
ncbi:MAG: right-handed parallel beta-helix repeat-containing protein [Gemmatimonadota bacterium]